METRSVSKWFKWVMLLALIAMLTIGTITIAGAIMGAMPGY